MSESSLYSSNLFSVSPVTKRMNLTPGQSYQGYVNITNPVDSDSTLHYKISILPYAVNGEDYEADLTNESDYTMISKWVTVDEPEGYVEKNETKKVYFTIDVPDDAPAGGQYCALAVRNVPDETTGTGNGVQIKDVLEITSVFYAQVDGEIKKEGEIWDNFVPFISLSNPLTTSVYLKNEGNVHQDALITLSVYSVFTGEKININETTDVATDGEEFGDGYFTELTMPQTTKYVSHEIEGMPSLGIFRVTQTVSFAGEENANEQIVVMCPGWFIGLVFLTIICVFVSIFSRKRRREKRKS